MSRSLLIVITVLSTQVMFYSIGFAQPVITGTRLTGPHGGYCPAFAMTEDGTVLAAGPVANRGNASRSKMYRRPQAQNDWREWNGVPDSAHLYCIESVSSTRILAGTSDGLYVSEAAAPGSDWQRIGFEGQMVTALNMLRDGNLYLCTDDANIYRSSDGGQSWTHYTPMDIWNQPFAIALAMDDAGRLYAKDYFSTIWTLEAGQWWRSPLIEWNETKGILPLSGNSLLAVNGYGIQRSTDGGQNWELRQPVEETMGEASFALSSSGSIYASMTYIADDTIIGGVYKSLDGGINWTKLHTGPITAVRMGPHGELLAAHFAAGIVQVDTANGATTFFGPPTALIHNIAVNRSPQTEDHIFATLDTLMYYTSGIVRSTDGGASWSWLPLSNRISDFETPPWPQLRQTHVIGDGSQSVVVWNGHGTRIHLSRDNGETWRKSTLPTSSVSIVLAASGTIHAAGNTPDGSVHSSTDDGASWTSSVVESGQAVTGLALSGGKLYAGTSTGVFRSTDAGSNWIRVLTLPVSGALVTGLAASDFVSVLDKPHIRLTYTSPSGSGMLVSADDGDTWTPLTLPGNIGALFAPGLDRDVYTVITAATFDHVDGAGDDPRMLLSHDGQSWKEVGPSPTCVSATTGTWYYGTRGFAVYHMQTPNGIGGTPAAAQGISLGQNYPNPFNPSTRLPFALEKPMRVTLVVTDVLGREVARPVDGELREAGSHVIDFDASAFPGGVYFCRIEAGGIVLHRAMTLLR